MENFELKNDIHLFCVKADSFPDGITAAHEKLAALVKSNKPKNWFGVSYWYDDAILYMAGLQFNPEADTPPHGCTEYTLRKGNYISIYIKDFATDVSRIGKAFETLLADHRIDENGCCAECYLPEGTDHTTAKDVRCMVRLSDNL